VPAVRIADAIKALAGGDVETPRFDSQWSARLVHVTAPDGFRRSVVGTPYGANRVPTAGTAEALFKIAGARISDTNDRNQLLGGAAPRSVGLRYGTRLVPSASANSLADCSGTNRRLSTARSNFGT
jgi:hypothetical protein